MTRNGITDQPTGPKWNVAVACMTSSGVTFQAIITGIIAHSEGEARVNAIKHALAVGVNVVLMAGAPPIPIRPAFVQPLDCEQDDSIEVTSQMPTVKGRTQ